MTLTLRNLPPEVAKAVKRRARSGRTSATRAVVELLEEAAGVSEGARGRQVHHDLDDLFGSMSAREANELEKAICDQRRIDQGQWQ
jgi:hypothetical protein